MEEGVDYKKSRMGEKDVVEMNIRKKSRCWCCWETHETKENQLIRVCEGCKDPDLQWIHQECIDKFISVIPTPVISDSLGRHEHHEDVQQREDVQLLEEETGGMTDNMLNRQSTFLNGNNRETMVIRTEKTQTSLLEKFLNHANIKKSIELHNKTSNKKIKIEQIQPGYYCNRCGDPYSVVNIPISPFKFIFKDKLALSIFIFMNVTGAIFTAYLISIIYDWRVNKEKISSDYKFFSSVMNLTNLASALMFCLIYILTLTSIWKHCRFHTYKKVLPIVSE